VVLSIFVVSNAIVLFADRFVLAHSRAVFVGVVCHFNGEDQVAYKAWTDDKPYPVRAIDAAIDKFFLPAHGTVRVCSSGLSKTNAILNGAGELYTHV
jgi:hypothetical protein